MKIDTAKLYEKNPNLDKDIKKRMKIDINWKMMLFTIPIAGFLLILILDSVVSQYGIIGYVILSAILALMMWALMDIYDRYFHKNPDGVV